MIWHLHDLKFEQWTVINRFHPTWNKHRETFLSVDAGWVFVSHVLRLPLDVGQPDMLAAGSDRWGGRSQLSWNLLWLHEWRGLRSVTEDYSSFTVSNSQVSGSKTLTIFFVSHSQSRGEWVVTALNSVGQTSSLTTSKSACLKKEAATTRWV